MSALNDLRLFRIYEPRELGKDGYPEVWHNIQGQDYGVKDLVREDAGHRCARCGHPYRKGENARGEWSPCDEKCTHGEPFRWHYKGETYHRGGDGPDDFAHDEFGFEPLVQALRDREGCVVEARWRILTVHHLNGRKHDLRWWNLIACCQRCHLWLQGTVIMERVYPWEHDRYFKPHAAGWYAYAYLGENLNKMQTMRRLDELLALERAA